MEIKGKIIQLLPMQTGQGKNGVWKKQEFILETPGEYPKKVCLSLWGAEKIDEYDLAVGMTVTAHINLESREYNSRWYTEARVWKIEGSSSRPKQDRVDDGESKKVEEWTPSSGGEEDDLPF
jgi:hypothetical protein